MTPEQRKQTPAVDYMTPIIADADAGFGGVTSVMKLTKSFIEAGVAGIHIEDQKAGAKKCGHLGGKVLVTSREQCQRLQAARLQADILGVELVICARTDALSASFIDTNIDPLDHPYILGQVDPQRPEELCCFPEAGVKAIMQAFPEGELQKKTLDVWNSNCTKLSLTQALELASQLNFTLTFDWEACRSDEGYYKIQGNVEYCVKRGIEFSKIADMLWMETPTPSLKVAQEFADGIHAVNPNVLLSYNLSPSFNWDAANMKDEDIKAFIPDLAKMGYCWQFITLAGFHLNSLMTEVLARDYSKKDMLAYVNMI